MALRNALVEVSQNSRSISSVYRDNTLRGHREMIEELRRDVSDRKLAKYLVAVGTTFAAVVALHTQSPAHRRAETLQAADTAVRLALDRISLIERKAPR